MVLNDTEVEGTVHDGHVADMPTDPTHVALCDIGGFNAILPYHVGCCEADYGAVECSAIVGLTRVNTSGTVEPSSLFAS